MVNTIYANARAISLHNSLLGVDRLMRMSDCGAKADAFRILAEANFGEGVSDNDYEALITVEERKFDDFVREVCPSENFKRYILIGKDYHNAEVFVRAKFLKFSTDKMLVPHGIYETEALREKILVDDYSLFGPTLAQALLATDNIFVEGKADGHTVNAIFRKALYKELALIAAKEKFIKELHTERADAVNISLALRSHNFKEAENEFVDGGTLTEQDLQAIAENGADAAKDRFAFSPLRDMITAAVTAAQKNLPLSEFERISDGFQLRKLKEKKYETDGYRPFALYCFYKLAELKNVRIIMSCLDNGIDKTEIKARVRETYEG